MRPLSVVLLGVCLALPSAPIRLHAQEPARSDGWVVIPVADYRALRAKAYPDDPVPAPPPVDAALTRLAYDLTLAGESITGTATADIDVLKDGWVEVLIPAGLLVRDARLDGRPVSLIDQPSPHVLLSKRGRSQLTLQIVLPVTPAGAAESVVVPPAPAALVEASLQIPRDGVEMTVANGFMSGQNQNAGTSRWTAYGRANEPLTFLWRRRVDDQRAGQPLRLRGSVVSLVGLGEDSTQLTATVQIEIQQGLGRSITLDVPQGVAINQVSGPLVADWDAASGGALHVTFLEPVAAATSFTVSGDVRGPHDGVVPVPLVRIPQADRETGGVAVEVLGAGEIVERQPLALEPADASDLGSLVRGHESPSLVAFRYKAVAGHDPRSLAVRVSRYATQAMQVANVDEARYQVLIAEDGKSMVKARYAVRNNHRGLLSVALPQGAALWQASVAGRPVRPGRSTDGALLIPLEKARSREDLPPFVVEMVYVMPSVVWTEKGTEDVTLPALDLPVSRTGVELHYSPRFRVASSTTSAFRVESYSDPFSPTLNENAPAIDVMESQSLSDKDEAAAAMKALVKQYQQAAGGRAVTGILPVQVPFPDFGAVLFLASELTPEARAPKLSLEYQRERGN
jgi:hypothetical protein